MGVSAATEIAPRARTCPVCGAELIVWEERNRIRRFLRGPSSASRGSPRAVAFKPHTGPARRRLIPVAVQPKDEADELPTELIPTAAA
jgi:hypothetical protein